MFDAIAELLLDKIKREGRTAIVVDIKDLKTREFNALNCLMTAYKAGRLKIRTEQPETMSP